MLRRFRIYAASAIFLILTAVKLLAPAPAADVRQEVAELIMRDDGYVKTAEALGKKLSVLGEPQESAAPVQATAPAAAYAVPTENGLSKSLAERPAAEPQETDSAKTQSESEKAVPQAVQTFLDSQKQYSAYAVPADVSYDMPGLPFKYAAPVNGVSSSGFGFRLHPIKKEVKFHYGTDFAAQSGEDVLAFADGKVEKAQEDETYGKYIVIDHDGGYKTLYAHCGRLYVSAGDTVKLGQKIALVGQTGSATGPHLHFELIRSGVYLNPEFYV